MASPAKYALPFPFHTALNQPVLERSRGGTTLFSAPPGFLFTERIAALAQEEHAPVLWLRAGEEDRDPGTLLASLVFGLAENFPAVSTHMLERMRQQPGPLFGWGSLYASLARDLADALPRDHPSEPRTPFTLVIEHIDQLNNAPQTAALLLEHFLPLLPSGSTRILTRHTAPPRSRLPGYVRQVGTRDLLLDERACLALAHDSCVRLPARSLQRMTALAEGREVVLVGLLSACRMLSSETINDIISTTNNLRDLLSRLARLYLDASPPGTADLLDLALCLEHINPPLIQGALGQAAEPPDLFLQSLTGSWARLRCTWQSPLRAVIRPDETQGRVMLERAARFLVQQGAYEQAIPLLLDLDEPHEAARMMVQVIEPLMDLGQWETLRGWLKRLPESVRSDWPWLVYTEGELAAANGQERTSRRIFAFATRLFREHHDFKGACQSLLTESCLYAWQNDVSRAQDYALQARTLAEKNELFWYQGWANWQLGRLSASAGRLAEALAYFNGAGNSAEYTGDAQMTSFIGQARQLAQAQIDHQQKKAQHVQGYYEADRAEHEAAARLRFLLENPAGQANDLRSLYGWSRTPLFLKLSPPEAAKDGFPGPGRVIELLRGVLRPTIETVTGIPYTPLNMQTGPLQGGAGFPEEHPSASVLPVTGIPFHPPAAGASPAAPTPWIDPSVQIRLPEADSPPVDAQPNKEFSEALSERPGKLEIFSPQPEEIQSVHHLNAFLLGAFRVIIDDLAVETLPSGRGRVVFAYLLSHNDHPLQREIIMDTFWPDASPEAARNSLNVAIYSLRQSLKSILNIPVVLFQENAYQLNPALVTWTDVHDFEQTVQEGRRSENNGQLASAIRNYEKALGFYQGDLLADFPYEEWAVLERERLRVLYLETLDRLSLIYFSQGQYTACAGLCNRVLTYDACREDAHCRLMRCYARQGQGHLALRQYQTCLDALHRELNVAPAPATVQLYDQIRRRETV